ncbi:hypothetical protein [Streptomyces sp. HUAS TT20]|uniref:hypothetical protein n=1 Tax=Streptomyces sp. HUAS TT20 TaxID=3447509 RepID=UPI0021DA2AD4|nr:hypothetical protein [Streptomyces sp. HUAS 15-9]UXY33161.1 hypothetical protein N8I87_42650 [Streptomyces sp. HUAS 15-9]
MDFEVLKARFFEALDRKDGSITAAARAAGVNRNDAAFGWARQAGVRGRGKPDTCGHPDAVAAELNSRPRKTLGWETPAERLPDLLTAKPSGVARTPRIRPLGSGASPFRLPLAAP